MRPSVVFTDLDATLLEPDGRIGGEARAALAALSAARIPVVPLTSKTERELAALLEELGSGGIGSFENGAGVVTPGGREVLPAARPVGRLAGALQEISASAGVPLTSALELPHAELARLTGLPEGRIPAMLSRQFDLPFLAPEGTGEALSAAAGTLPDVRLTRGGRFFHLLGRHDKEDAVRWLLDRGVVSRPAAGFGDAPNDAGFLALCDVAVVVPGPGGPDPSLLSRLPGARVAPAPGGRGWAAVVHALLEGKEGPR